MVGVSVFQLLTQTPPLESKKKKMEIDVLTITFCCGNIWMWIYTAECSN